ncbi:hypothetical protein J6590_051299 [Homalodisca vitripennis]|nr:hypothetical protein J6590_051299 [Homalodisca vitripennis]
MPAIWAELVLAHFQRLQTRNAAQDFGSVSPAQSAFHYYNSSNLCCCTAAVPVVARTLLSLLTVAARPGPARTSAACGWFLLPLAPNITGTRPVPQCHGTGIQKQWVTKNEKAQKKLPASFRQQRHPYY